MAFCALRRDEEKGNREILGTLASEPVCIESEPRVRGKTCAWRRGPWESSTEGAESRGSGMGCTCPGWCHGPGSGSSDAIHELGDLGQPT